MPKSNSTDNALRYNCCQCDEPFDSLSEFYKSYSSFYARTNHLPICKKCLNRKFNEYALEYHSTKKAMQRICMAYDLYYNESIFDSCDNGNDNVIVGNYIKKLNMAQYKGRTFDTSLEEGFFFTGEKTTPLKETDEDSDEPQIDPKDIDTWGGGLSAIDYDVLNSHYKFLKSANPQCDSNAEIFITDLCYTKMQQMKAVREGRVDDYNKLTETYRKSFTTAGLKTVREANIDEEFTIGVNAETIEKYTPAEYYKNKQLYKDHDDLGEYLDRFLLRPLRNLMHGTKDRDYEFFVKDEGDSNEYDDEE